MDIQRVDTQHAYELIRARITTLRLAPGELINSQQLAAELEVPLFAVEEALKLLAHEHLVRITPRHGTYVADVDIADLEQLSELRAELEALAAALAAQRASQDDLAVLEALRQAHIDTDPADARTLFDIDQQFHRAIAHAAGNAYLAQTLDHFFGLSLRLWYVALPHLESLPGAVEKHIQLVDAIRQGDSIASEEIARSHVREFYAEVRKVLAAGGGEDRGQQP